MLIQQLFLLLVVLELLILIMMQIILVKKSIELAIPLKYLGNFWRALNIPLISCEVSLELKWNNFNVIIDKLAFFDLPIKTEEEAYEKIIDISKNNEYTTGTLLDYDYFK